MTLEAAQTYPFAHTGRFFNVLGLALKNAALTVLTLTLYRFWARTAMRRRMWSRVVVMGDPLEYTGTAWELFRGFLISLVFFFIPAIFVLYIAPLMMESITAAWLTFGFYALLNPLFAAARYWMRRYQLSRTRWRGIRHGLAGSAWSFAAASWGWWVLEMLSLFWYAPAAHMNRARMIWNNTRFGDQPFEFINDGESPQKTLWGPFALGWCGTLVLVFATPIAIGIIAAALAFGAAAGAAQPGDTPPPIDPALTFVPFLVLPVALLVWFAIWAPYRAAAMNRVASLVSLDGARFKLRVKTFPLLLVQLSGWLIIIFSLGLLAPLAGYIQLRYVINRLEIIGTPKFAEIGQPVIGAPGAGESLGDAFDLDFGVGVI